jgi:hypothetical protein
MLDDWHDTRDLHLSAFRTAIEEEDSVGVEHYIAAAAAIEARWPSHRVRRSEVPQ